MDKEKEIEKLKLIIAENMATYSKAKMPYEEALKMSALGILASGYGNVKQAVTEFAESLLTEVKRIIQKHKADYEEAEKKHDNYKIGFYTAQEECCLNLERLSNNLLKELEVTE